MNLLSAITKELRPPPGVRLGARQQDGGARFLWHLLQSRRRCWGACGWLDRHWPIRIYRRHFADFADSGITPAFYLNSTNTALPSYTPPLGIDSAYGTGFTTNPAYSSLSPNSANFADPYLSKSLDDTGASRSAYGVDGIPASYLEYGLSAMDIPNHITFYAVYNMPFGHRGGFRITNELIKDWSVSGTFRYQSGTPITVTSSGCNTPDSGTCYPNLNPNYPHSPADQRRVGPEKPRIRNEYHLH